MFYKNIHPTKWNYLDGKRCFKCVFCCMARVSLVHCKCFKEKHFVIGLPERKPNCMHNSLIVVYTARQLSGATLPVRPFCLTAGESLSISIETRLQYMKDLSRPSDKLLWSNITFAKSWSTFPRECWSPQLSQKLCVTFVLIVFSAKLSLYTNL